MTTRLNGDELNAFGIREDTAVRMVDELAGILFALDRLSKVLTVLPGASTEQQEEILSEIERLNSRIELIALICEHAN